MHQLAEFQVSEQELKNKGDAKQMTNEFYDYKNQAWVVNGKYIKCNHPDEMNCNCYGKLHEGEIAAEEPKEENSDECTC